MILGSFVDSFYGHDDYKTVQTVFKRGGLMKKILLLLALFSLFGLGCNNASDDAVSNDLNAASEVSSATYGGTGSDVMLQGFTWNVQSGEWTTISSNASAIASAGFTMVWLPPCSMSADTNGYLPTQWNNLASNYGTQAQLQAAITALHSNSVKAIADIVINHRCGSTNWADFSNPAFATNSAAICSDDEYFQSGNPGYGVTPKGAADSGSGYTAGRDLDHSNASVQSVTKTWLAWLKSTIGYDGWRFDFVKGYNGSYVGVYDDATSPSFSVGEYWPSASFSTSNPNAWRQEIVNWIDATGGKSAVFDFVTKPLLASAISNSNYALLKDSDGKAAGTIGWWPALSVTFLDNHDTAATPYGQGLWSFPSGSEAVGYAYILTHPGTPCVFWPHYFNYGTTLQSAIKTMISIRKAQGITSTSAVSIQAADSTKYAAIVNGNTAVKIGPGSWTPTGSWTLATSGTNYAIWTLSSATTPSAPATITAVAASSSSIDVTWAAASGATSYTLYKATSSTGTYAAVATTTALSYDASGLTASTPYYFKVTATNTAGTSGYSPVATATTTAAATTNFQVHFKVNSYANWSTVYCYYWGSNGSTAANTWPGNAMTSEGNSWYVYSVSGTSSSIIFNNNSSQTIDLSRTGEGWFVPTGTSSGKITGTWYSSDPTSTTVPTAPATVKATAASSSSIIVSWSESTGASSYTVYKATSSTGTYTSVGTTTGDSLTVTGLTAATTYYFKVTATDTAGTSGYSAVASVATTSSSAVTTTIKVCYDCGYGNSMTIRGDTSPLTWTAGVAMTWTTGNVWVYTTTAITSGKSIQFKVLKNDSTWSTGANFTATGGATTTVTPTF